MQLVWSELTATIISSEKGVSAMPLMIKPPFFEIGPKSYLFGDDVLDLALSADQASIKYDVDIIFTAPLIEIRRIADITKKIHVFAPHMDPIVPGRGLAEVLPESLRDAGATGVMLNHNEKPLTMDVLERTIERAKEVGLATIVCSNTVAQAAAIAHLGPDIIVAEPSELIGTGQTSDDAYMNQTTSLIKSINPAILVLQGAGISSGEDVYRVILAGADATGSSSGIVKATDRAAMIDEMISSVRSAWNKRH